MRMAIPGFVPTVDALVAGTLRLCLVLSFKVLYIHCQLENVEHCGGEPERGDTGYYVTDG